MTDYIGYEALMQSALKGVVREALRHVERNPGATGDHHFYITFRTKAPGVEIAPDLVARFPNEMTIVVQHQYWDLEVHDTHFEVILKFSGVPQHLRIPFDALTRFFDPSVSFGLSFDDADSDLQSDEASPAVPSSGSGDTAMVAPAKAVGDADAATVVDIDAFRRK